MVVLAAVGTCGWRVAEGHKFLPGLFTVVFVPLSLFLFLALDAFAHFRLLEWMAVAGVVCAHMVLSVPAFPGPLYYRGPVLLHPDHLMHVLAGGLVTTTDWLSVVSSGHHYNQMDTLRDMASNAIGVLAVVTWRLRRTDGLGQLGASAR
jgi:hypothetical protein